MTNTCRDNCHGDANTPQTAEVHDASHGGFVSEYLVPKMDCPSEEGLIRMALDSVEPKVVLEFDTLKRKVRVFHGDNADAIEERMRALGLGATLESTTPVARDDLGRAQASAKQEAQTEARILKWLLAINGIMFVIEITVGWWTRSTGLIAMPMMAEMSRMMKTATP